MSDGTEPKYPLLRAQREGRAVIHGRGEPFATCLSHEDAEYVARAVNAHAELVAVARLALVMFCDPHTLSIDPAARNLKAMAESALAKVDPQS